MNKHIEEMAKIMCQDAGTKNCNIRCNAKPICDVRFYAERLYKEGYRKQSEDMVSVVRCKDCFYVQFCTSSERYYCQKTYQRIGVEEDDFCSYGRKDQ